jgi:hypothetical protein
MVERFDRSGRWLEDEWVRWNEAGERDLEGRDLADVLAAFGVPEEEARATAAELRARLGSLAPSDEPRWKGVAFLLEVFGIAIGGWVLALVLVSVLLVLAVR